MFPGQYTDRIDSYEPENKSYFVNVTIFHILSIFNKKSGAETIENKNRH